jgi:isopenicillin-N epimerase
VTTAEAFVETVWAGVTPRTRVLSISHITSPTALIFPIAELIARARAAGITTVIDGAHAPGQIPLDMHALGADFYVGNCHKWLMSPKGAAFLYASRERQALLRPLIVSWGWRSASPSSSQFVDEQEYQGTRDIAAYLAVPAVLEFMQRHNWDAVRRGCHALLVDAAAQVRALTGLPPIVPDDSWFGQMASLPLPPTDMPALARRLYDEYHIEVPLVTWQGLNFVRVSVQGYTTPEEIGTLVGALRTLLPELAV